MTNAQSKPDVVRINKIKMEMADARDARLPRRQRQRRFGDDRPLPAFCDRPENYYPDMMVEHFGVTHEAALYKEFDVYGSREGKTLDPIACAGRVRMHAVWDMRDKTIVRSEGGGGADDTWPEEIMRSTIFGMAALFETNKEWVQIEAQEVRHYYHKSIDQLAAPDCRVLGEATIEEIQSMYAGYFEVPKKEEVMRAIFDCRPQNAWAKRPPQFRLTRPADMIWMLTYFNDPWVASADFRHWFYQITIPEDARRFFNIRKCGQDYQLQVLPMGFSWSPIIAQTISWMLMLSTEETKDDPLSFDAPGEDGRVPPPYVVVRRGKNLVAFIIVYYDNIVIVAKDECTRRELVARLKHNCDSRKANAQLKIPKDNGDDPIEYFRKKGRFLGLEYDLETTPGYLEWRHADTQQWRDLAEAPLECTARELARMVGVAVWDKTLRQRSLNEIHRTIRMMSSKQITRQPERWRTKLRLTEEEQQLWRSTMAPILRNEPERIKLRANTGPIAKKKQAFLASDASNKAWGAVHLSRDGKVIASTRGTWTAAERKRNIFWREMKAAEYATDWFWENDKNQHVQSVRMAIDNKAAKAVVSKWYSACPEANLLLEGWKPKMRGREITATWVGTNDQAADEPSRLRDMDDDRCKRCAAILAADEPVQDFITRLYERAKKRARE